MAPVLNIHMLLLIEAPFDKQPVFKAVHVVTTTYTLTYAVCILYCFFTKGRISYLKRRGLVISSLWFWQNFLLKLIAGLISLQVPLKESIFFSNLDLYMFAFHNVAIPASMWSHRIIRVFHKETLLYSWICKQARWSEFCLLTDIPRRHLAHVGFPQLVLQEKVYSLIWPKHKTFIDQACFVEMAAC